MWGRSLIPKLRTLLYQIYRTIVSLIGFGPIIWGIPLVVTCERPVRLILLLLLSLAVLAQRTATLAFRGIHFSVGSAISLATIPLYGPTAAAVVAAASETSRWLIRIRNGRPGTRQAVE